MASRDQQYVSDLGEQVALSLIAEDLRFFIDFLLDSRLSSIRPIAILALMPFLSTFVYESGAYVERKGLVSVQDLKPHRSLLLTSRQRVKQLEDSRRSFEELLKSASELAAINNKWMLGLHRGVLAPLKRRLQPELGIFFLHDAVVCTTHVAFLNLGLTKEALAASSLSLDNLGPHMMGVTADFGEYMSLLALSLGIDIGTLGAGSEAPVPLIRFRDVKQQPFYESLARQVAPQQTPVCILLTSILSQVNTARFFVALISGRNTLAAFKTKFVSLYHVASSLQKLLNEDRSNRILHPEAAHRIGAMLGTTSIRRVRKLRSLRNNLVHYAVDEKTTLRLSSDLPLFGLVEAHSAGKSLTSVADDVDSGLVQISDGLRDMLVPNLTPLLEVH